MRRRERRRVLSRHGRPWREEGKEKRKEKEKKTKKRRKRKN